MNGLSAQRGLVEARPPLPELFTCPRHPGGLRLTQTACAALWLRGRAVERLDASSLCHGCPVGARNAQGPEKAPSPLRRACACCGDTERRFVPSSGLCISCYNRQREILRGRDRRGNSLVGRALAPLVRLVLGGTVISRPGKSLLAVTAWALRQQDDAWVSRAIPEGYPLSQPDACWVRLYGR